MVKLQRTRHTRSHTHTHACTRGTRENAHEGWWDLMEVGDSVAAVNTLHDAPWGKPGEGGQDSSVISYNCM